MEFVIGVIFNLFKKIINYFYNDFNVEKVLVALIAYLIIRIISYLFNIIKMKQRNNSKFNITGFWVAQFPSFIYEGRNIIELYYIKQKFNELSIRIQHYSDYRVEISKLYGKGEIRDDFISFYYSTAKKASKVLGVACLKVRNEDVETLNLCGNCYEDFSRLSKKQQDHIRKLQKKDILVLKKIKLPWYRKVLFRCGVRSFRGCKDFKIFIGENNGF